MIKFSDKTYNILKWVIIIVLPALTTFYGVLGSSLNLPHTETILTIAVAFTTCLGTCLGISCVNYNKGE